MLLGEREARGRGSTVMIPEREPVARRVRALDRLVGAVDDLDRGHRPERLDAARAPSPAGTSATSVAWKHGPTASPPASTFAPGGDRVVDALLDRRERVLVDQRPDDRVHLLRVAGLEARRLLREPRDVNSSAIGRSTMIRRADMQIWPWCRNAPNAAASTA